VTDLFGEKKMFGYGWPEVPESTKLPKKCPRCGGWIPNDETPGAYMGAMSRYMVPIDGELRRCIEICSACGEHEAFQQAGMYPRGSDPTGLTPPHDWPIPGLYEENVRRWEERREQMRRFEELEREREVIAERETDAVLQMEDGQELRMQSTRPRSQVDEQYAQRLAESYMKTLGLEEES